MNLLETQPGHYNRKVADYLSGFQPHRVKLDVLPYPLIPPLLQVETSVTGLTFAILLHVIYISLDFILINLESV